MSMVAFSKMHGAGNDFVVLDRRGGDVALSPARIRALGDRRRGIGFDQLILIDPPASPDADVVMRIYNPDGSEAGACGNATRCVAEMLGQQSARDTLAVQTVAGVLPAQRLGEGRVRVDMGPPRLDWRDIPLAHDCDTLHLPLPGDPAACSMGNPHATLFLDSFESVDVAALGVALENDPLFPDRANIGFASILSERAIRLHVWERGAGLTLACGSGACAAVVNACRRGLTGRIVDVILDVAMLTIAWRESDSHVLMTGPTETAFTGEVDLSTYPE